MGICWYKLDVKRLLRFFMKVSVYVKLGSQQSPTNRANLETTYEGLDIQNYSLLVKDVDYRLYTFLRKKGGGVFREKNFFRQVKWFALDKILLKSFFNFRLRYFIPLKSFFNFRSQMIISSLKKIKLIFQFFRFSISVRNQPRLSTKTHNPVDYQLLPSPLL